MKLSALAVACVILLYGLYVRDKSTQKTSELVGDRHTLFIQGLLKSDALDAITRDASSAVNQIIKEELGLASDSDFFFPKERQRLTLYSLNEADIGAAQSLVYPVIDSFFEANRARLALDNVHLKAGVNLFGVNQNELVIMVDDYDGELSKLNDELKAKMHQINADYQQVHGVDLYDIAKSERFEYVPHIGIGRLSLRLIKEQIKEGVEFEEVFNQITQRVLQTTLEIVNRHLTCHTSKITFDALGVLDLQSRTYVKEYALKSHLK